MLKNGDKKRGWEEKNDRQVVENEEDRDGSKVIMLILMDFVFGLEFIFSHSLYPMNPSVKVKDFLSFFWG